MASMRRIIPWFTIIVVTVSAAAGPRERPGENMAAVSYENDYLRLALGADGRTSEFIDKETGQNYAKPGTPFCRVSAAGGQFPADSITRDGDEFVVSFGETDFEARLRITTHPSYLVLEVLSLDGDGVDVLQFLDVPLTLAGKEDEAFAACAMALNLQTNVHRIPQPTDYLQAMCYPRFGFAGAEVAVIGCPRAKLRDIMKTVVEDAEEIPKNSLGGPFALDAEETRGSYLMDTRASVTESTVDDWIRLARELGVLQLDFHAGHSLRFGDYEPNPDLYPDGLESVRRVTDKLKEAGILAGLHTYAFFIAKNTPWVTPIPHPDLAKDATYTLAAAITADATIVPVLESTEDRSTDTGFFVANSMTLQIDDELIVYRDLSKESPYAFTECERGAHGTKAAAHDAGTKAHHLKQMFYLFMPEPDSELLDEVIERTAYVYNRGGFSMMYLDALDGSYMFAGPENAWHYGAKFVFELIRRVERPPLMEMSTFHHHLWYARSRVGAWDFTKRGYKPFIDMHVLANRWSSAMFLPSHLGWWGIWNWNGQDYERMFPDDVEYTCCKALAWDSGLSWIHGIDKDHYFESPNLQRLGRIIRQYEELRLSRAVPESILERLREPGAEYTLRQETENEFAFYPVQYAKHRVNASTESRTWTVENPFEGQPLQIRIQAALSVAPYDDAESKVLTDFAHCEAFSEKQSKEDVVSTFRAADGGMAGSGILSASSRHSRPDGAWTMIGRRFDPFENLKQRGLGVWIEGDGRGEILNLQIKGSKPFRESFFDHYIKIDFTGRRYFELVEPETDRIPEYDWPYCPRREDWEAKGAGLLAYAYPTWYFALDRDRVEAFNLWFNNLPADGSVSCTIGPVKSLPLKNITLVNPTVSIGDRKLVFPVELHSGEYLEFLSPSDCKVYDAEGNPIGSVTPQGEVPSLETGVNQLSFDCDVAEEFSARAMITVISRGAPLRWQTP